MVVSKQTHQTPTAAIGWAKLRLASPRIAAGAALVLLTGAAGPPSAAYLITTYPGSTERADTQPRRIPTMAYTAAPMPNSDVSAPVLERPAPSQASVSPSLFAPRNAYHGEGYVPGSTVQSQQERKVRPAPGINLSVPLQ